MIKKWILAFIVTYPSLLIAGQTVGNGGYIADCGIGKRQMLEVCEAKNRRNLMPEMGAPELSVDDKLAIVIERLEKLDPERASRWQRKLFSFWSQVLFVDYDLNPVAEHDHGGVDAAGIENVQRIAVRQIKESPLDYEYLINREYEALDNTNKAILILHEIIATEAKTLRGHHDTRRVRFFLGTLVSDYFERHPEKYQEILDYSRMNAYLAGQVTRRLVLFENLKLSSIDANDFCSRLDTVYGGKYSLGYTWHNDPEQRFIINHVASLPDGENVIFTVDHLEALWEVVFTNGDLQPTHRFRKTDGKTPRLFICLGKDFI